MVIENLTQSSAYDFLVGSKILDPYWTQLGLGPGFMSYSHLEY